MRFEFEDEAAPCLELPAPLAVSRVPIPDLGATALDLTVEVSGVDGSILAYYSTDLYNPDTVARYLDCYAALLEAAAAAPTAPTASLAVLSPSRRRELDLFSAGAERPHFLAGPLLHQQFAARAAAAPDAPCLLLGPAALPYGAVSAKVAALAAALRRDGVARGARVGVMLERSFELMVAMLATLEVGAAYLPLDPGYPAARLAIYMEDAAPEVVIIGAGVLDADAAAEALAALPPGARRPRLLPLDLAALDPAAAPLDAAFDAAATLEMEGDVAVVIFTSGSTGRPKGVELTHAGLRDAVAASYVDMYGGTAADVYALCTTINFDPHLGNSLGAMCCGAALAILPPGAEADADVVVSMCLSARVTVLEQAPSVVALWVPALVAAADKLALRVLIMGGEAMPPTVAAALQRGVPGLASGVYNT